MGIKAHCGPGDLLGFYCDFHCDLRVCAGDGKGAARKEVGS